MAKNDRWKAYYGLHCSGVKEHTQKCSLPSEDGTGQVDNRVWTVGVERSVRRTGRRGQTDQGRVVLGWSRQRLECCHEWQRQSMNIRESRERQSKQQEQTVQMGEPSIAVSLFRNLTAQTGRER